MTHFRKIHFKDTLLETWRPTPSIDIENDRVAILATNRTTDRIFDIDNIDKSWRFQYDSPPARFVPQGISKVNFSKVRRAAISSRFRFLKRETNMQILPRCAWRLSLNDYWRKLT